jgi:hypothetical protein
MFYEDEVCVSFYNLLIFSDWEYISRKIKGLCMQVLCMYIYTVGCILLYKPVYLHIYHRISAAPAGTTPRRFVCTEVLTSSSRRGVLYIRTFHGSWNSKAKRLLKVTFRMKGKMSCLSHYSQEGTFRTSNFA